MTQFHTYEDMAKNGMENAHAMINELDWLTPNQQATEMIENHRTAAMVSAILALAVAVRDAQSRSHGGPR